MSAHILKAWWGLVASLLFSVVAAAQAPAGDGVTLLKIDGPLDVGTLSLVRRATTGAIERGDRLLIEMNTPGGEIELMWKIARAIGHASEQGLLTVTWVNDQALSAGALIAMACDRIYMRSRASIGSATAITVGPLGVQPVSSDSAVTEKFNSAFRSQFRGWAEEHGRSGEIAEAMVDAETAVRQIRVDGELLIVSDKQRDDIIAAGTSFQLIRTVVQRGELLNLTGTEALEIEFIDGLAESLDEVYERIGARGVSPTIVLRQRSENIASALDGLTPLLIIFGLILAFMEIKMPGFGLPGIGSILCFSALLFGRYLVGLADIPHIVAVALGVILIATEIFLVPGTLWAGISGGILVLGGLIWSNLGPGYGLEYPLDRTLAIDSAFETLAWAAAAAGLMMLVSRFLPKTELFNRMALVPSGGSFGDATGATTEQEIVRVGAKGRALTDLRPVGKVMLAGDDREFEATAPAGLLVEGTDIRVTEVLPGGRLEVEQNGLSIERT
ncbi:MAG: membrane-bound serine protease (ClpP class) [Planctomycetota bacterium]|jgi:membrane-bound serine protease (ClpP class)